MSKTKIDVRTLPDVKPLETFDDANQALLQLGRIESLLQDKEAELNEKIQRLRDEFDLMTARTVQSKEMLSAQLEKFALANKNEFEKERSRTLLHGTIGLRWTPPKVGLLNPKYNWDSALELLRKFKWGKDFIRTKDEVDKEALLSAISQKEIDDSKLAAVGLKIDSKENFFYEINWESLQ